MDAWPYVWRVRTRLPWMFGRRCRVLVRGRMNSCLVEFECGYRVVTSRNYVRKAAQHAAEAWVGTGRGRWDSK